MIVRETKISGVFVIEPQAFGDHRGFFLETFQKQRYETQKIAFNFVQDNHSRSIKNVLRGLHHQKEHMQGKLIFVVRGAIFDVAVDIRPDSPTFGQWEGIILDDTHHHQLYIPPGCAHGFCVISDIADFIYKCTDYYDAPSEMVIAWNDPHLNIEWPIHTPILSPKDQQGRFLRDIPKNELPTLGKCS